MSSDVDSAASAAEGALSRITERAFGGKDVAEVPDDEQDEFWPTAPSAAGADEALEFLLAGLHSGARPRFVFLVGGPGNGKSFLTQRAVTSVLEAGGRSHPGGDPDLALRKYEYETASSSRFVVINDASIAGEGGAENETPLIDDLNGCVDTESFALVCVNRGVLFEEIAANKKAHGTSVGSLIIKWLSGDERETLSAARSADFDNDFQLEFARTCTLALENDLRIDLVAVFMDKCSLFEPRPELVLPESLDTAPTCTPYLLTSIADRSSMSPSSLPALRAIADLLAQIEAPTHSGEGHLDPFAANIASLKSSGVLAAVGTVIRAGELATGDRLTFREVWGATARMILGDVPHLLPDAQTPTQWLNASQPPQERSQARHMSVLSLAGLRLHQALFGAEPFPLLQTPRVPESPVERTMRSVDPVRDAVPGEAGRRGWASPVLESFSALAYEESPLDYLLNSDGSSEVLNQFVTDFDRDVDRSVLALIRPSPDGREVLNDPERRQVLSWYGEYLLRMYALAHGIPAFSDAVSLRIELWKHARATRQLQEPFKSRLRTLLLPSFAPEQSGSPVLLPIFASRTVPVTGVQEEPVVAASVPPFVDLSASTSGEGLFVELHVAAAKIAELELDLMLVREAESCSQGHLGLTDSSAGTAPRLERFRSSLLRSEANLPLVVASGSTVSALTISDGNP